MTVGTTNNDNADSIDACTSGNTVFDGTIGLYVKKEKTNLNRNSFKIIFVFLTVTEVIR